MKDFKIDLTENYPIIVTPKYLNSVSNEEIKFSDYYPNVKKPAYKPYPPGWDLSNPTAYFVQKGEEPNLLLGQGCSLFIILVVVGFPALIISEILNISKDDYQTYWLPCILVITAVVFIFFFYDVSKGQKIIKENKQNEIVEANKKIREKYNKDLKDFELLEKSINDKEFRKSEILKRVTLQNESNKEWIFKSLEILNDNEVKKGLSEEFFYKYLKNKSDLIVYKSIKYSYYYPDLIIAKDNLVIDLEIDEPYTFETKEPIHYINSDSSRDEHFVNRGFILIRFTENQILDNPDFCLKVINDVIESCLKLEEFKKINYAKIQTSLLSHHDCFNLAYNNSRSNIPFKIIELQNKYNL